MKSYNDLKNIYDLLDGLQVGWNVHHKFETVTGGKIRDLILKLYRKKIDAEMRCFELEVKLKQAEDAYWQVQKMHDLWTRSQKMKELIYELYYDGPICQIHADSDKDGDFVEIWLQNPENPDPDNVIRFEIDELEKILNDAKKALKK